MRLIRLRVEHFGCVRSAAVDFGPGLNVLYGPNDLGKSTLAAAIRAALLMQHSSRAHERWVEWQSDEMPWVELTFETEPRRIWRVTKRFGSHGSSLFESSRDGETFTIEAKGRQVDGELRQLLKWGIPGPGGKGAPRRAESFLTTALLAEQDKAAEILARRIDEDADESGRELLTEALQALVQDPLFGQVLQRAQEKVDEAFTPKGTRKTGRDAPFPRIRERIREAEERVAELERQAGESAAVHDHLRTLYDLRLVRHGEIEEATARRRELEGLWSGETARRELGERLRVAREELTHIETALGAVADAEKQQAELESALGERSERVTAATAALAQVEVEEKQAADELRRLQSEEGEAQRLVRQQALEKRQLEIKAAADAARRRAEQARAAAEATSIRKEAAEQETRAAEIRSEIAALRLPSAEELAELRKLRQELRVVEARLEVGLSVAVRPHRPFELKYSRDGEEVQSENLSSLQVTLEAQRQLKLVLDDLADVRVTGGTQEAREEAEVLRARWQRQAEPVLRASRVATVDELDAAFQAADQRRRQAAELEQEAKALRSRAEVLAGVDRDEEVEDWQQAMAEAESALEALAVEEESVVAQLAALGEEGVTGLGEAESRLEKATAAVAEARARKDREQQEQESVRQELDRVRGELGVRREQAATLDHEGARRQVEALTAELDALPAAEGPVSEEDLEGARRRVEEAAAALREVESQVRGEEGALRQVGGDVVRERLEREQEVLDQRREEEAELEKDYGAWQLLLDTLRAAENEQAAHLGQALVVPVSERFRELTRGRYGPLTLGPHLETQGIEAAGGRQEIDVLSVGTRDQLSTILRLSLAQQLGTAVLLDDQLAQSDPRSMGWFGDLLRECAGDVQIVVLTCRPEDYLRPEEMPGTPSQLSLLDSSDDLVRAVDLVQIVDRSQ